MMHSLISVFHFLELCRPGILFWLKFTDFSAGSHILAWSIWLSISCAFTCATSIIVDVFPFIVTKLFELLYGSKPEKLKTQIELWMNVRYWTKLALAFAWFVRLILLKSSSVNLTIMCGYLHICLPAPKSAIGWFYPSCSLACSAFTVIQT